MRDCLDASGNRHACKTRALIERTLADCRDVGRYHQINVRAAVEIDGCKHAVFNRQDGRAELRVERRVGDAHQCFVRDLRAARRLREPAGERMAGLHRVFGRRRDRLADDIRRHRIRLAIDFERGDREVGDFHLHVPVGHLERPFVRLALDRRDGDFFRRLASEAEHWPDTIGIRLNVAVPIITGEAPCVVAPDIRSRPIVARYCRTAGTCSDIGIHIAVVYSAVIITSRRAEIDEYRFVVALLCHGPVRHGGIAQRGVARQVGAACGIVGQNFQRGAGVTGRGLPAVDGVPILRRSVLQSENQAVALLRHLADDADCGAAVGNSGLRVVQMAVGAHHLADVLRRGGGKRQRYRNGLDALHLVLSGVGDRHRVALHQSLAGGDGPVVGVFGAVLQGRGVGRIDVRALGDAARVHRAADRHRAASAIRTCADAARCIIALDGRDARYAVGNCNCAAAAAFATADGCRVFAACRNDRAALDDDVAAGNIIFGAITSADAGSPAVAGCVERAFALDGQRRTLRHENAGIVGTKATDGIFAFEDDSGVAFAGDARP